MKTIEEIEQLAIKDFNNRQECGHYELADLKSRDYYYDGFINAYTQCQEDMKIVISEWQLCPMCLGEGRIANVGTSSSTFRICPVCNGSRTLIKPYLNKQD